MIRYELAGKAALVTGGASGIGLALVEQLARNGAKVAINHLADDARGPEQVERLRAAGFDVIGAPGNVGDAVDCERMVLAAIRDLGRLDYLACNAGTPGTRTSVPPSALDRLTEELWNTVIQVNLLGVFRCVKAAAPALKAARGAVVSTASIAGLDSRLLHGLWRDQGRRDQPDQEPGAHPGTGSTGQCGGARRGGQLLDDRMDQ
ncbi:SDR family NAD(P)-dependent oxidoreductase [Siccirubricoccus deserti]